MNRNIHIILVVCLSIVASLLLFLIVEREGVPPQSIEVRGEVSSIALSARVITISTTDHRQIDIAVSAATELTDSEGVTTSFASFEPGVVVVAYGRYTSDTHFLVDKIQIISKRSID